MMSLRQACTCTRYLSPTRLSSNAAHPVCLHVSSPDPLRKKALITNSRLCSTAVKHRRIATQCSSTNLRSLSDDSRRGGDVLQPTHSVPNSPTKLTVDAKSISNSLDSLANGLKQWTQNTKVSIDVTALSKMISALNIDLPKLPQYRKLFQKSITSAPKSTSSVNETQNVETDEERLKKRERLLEIASDQAGKREEHDLNDAMATTQECIQAYYRTVDMHLKDGPARCKDDIDAELIKKSISKSQSKLLERVASESTLHATVITPPSAETENILVRQLGNLRQMIPGKGEPKGVKEKEEEKKVPKKRASVSKVFIERRTRGLVIALKEGQSNASQLQRLQDLCSHLQQYPNSKNLAYKEKIVPTLLRMRGCSDPLLRNQALEALALVGYNNPVKGRGIRILSLDGGGTRGLMTIVMMRKLEEACGAPIRELFDYVCGVSTGSLISAMCAVYGASMDKCDEVYRRFSTQMFNRNKLMGTGKLFLSHAYYDAQIWEEILKENIGLQSFLATSHDPDCPKVAAASCLVNQPTMENFLFRNYTYAPGVYSHYPGSMKYKIWESIRASSAAPGYYEQFQLDDRVHQDGGILTNNPTALALHECKLLWPNEDIQCVVSLGTGRFRPINEPDPDSVTLKNKIYKIVQSATDTESVHTILNDLLPPSTYFRFNPYMSEDFQLDEIRQDKWDQMDSDVQMYCRKNDHKFKDAANKLLQTKLPHQKAFDWLNLQKDTRF